MNLQQTVQIEVKDHDYMGSANIHMLINGAEFSARKMQNDKIRSECLKIVSNIVSHGQEFNISCRDGSRNEEYSESYKRRIREQDEEDTRNKIGKEKNKSYEFQERIDRIMDNIATLSTGDPVLDHMQDQEVRTRLAKEDDSTLSLKYNQCIQSGNDVAFIRAMENDPIGRSFVRDETRLQSRLAVAAKVGSQEASDVKDLMLAIQIVELAGVRAEKLLHSTYSDKRPLTPHLSSTH